MFYEKAFIEVINWYTLLEKLNSFYFFISWQKFIQRESNCYSAYKLPSAGSVDNKLAMCAAEASKPSQSFGPSSESSPMSNPDQC